MSTSIPRRRAKESLRVVSTLRSGAVPSNLEPQGGSGRGDALLGRSDHRSSVNLLDVLMCSYSTQYCITHGDMGSKRKCAGSTAFVYTSGYSNSTVTYLVVQYLVADTVLWANQSKMGRREATGRTAAYFTPAHVKACYRTHPFNEHISYHMIHSIAYKTTNVSTVVSSTLVQSVSGSACANSILHHTLGYAAAFYRSTAAGSVHGLASHF